MYFRAEIAKFLPGSRLESNQTFSIEVVKKNNIIFILFCFGLEPETQVS